MTADPAMKAMVDEVTAGLAIAGNLYAIDCMLLDDDPKWVLYVLDRTDSWLVRVAATELLRDWGTSTQMRADELARFKTQMRDFAHTAVGVRLSPVEQQQLLLADPHRDFELSPPPDQVSTLFWAALAEVEDAQERLGSHRDSD